MSKVIITQGEGVAEYELGDKPLLIGRDPDCELFFADRKLSRRHARLVPGPAGVTLVDLGSRNGTWVNEERITERLLEHGDSIRLGGLRITYESEPRPGTAPAPDETAFLTGASDPDTAPGSTLALDPGTVALESVGDGDGTVALRSESAGPSAASSPSSSSTRRFTAIPDDDETLERNEHRPDSAPGRTIRLDGRAPERPPDTGPMILPGRGVPAIVATRAVGAEEAPRPPSPQTPRAAPRPASAPGSRSGGYILRLTALVAVAALFAVVVLAVPLMRTLGAALAQESHLRGRALVRLLAATNEAALAENRHEDVSVERVLSEPNVSDAFVLDGSGRVVAPRERSGELPELGLLNVAPGDLSGLRAAREDDGSLILAEPVRHLDRRVGVAVVRLQSRAAGWPALVLLLGSALLLMGLATAVLLTKRLTLASVRELRRDVEALPATDFRRVSTERPFAELSDLARSVNRVLGAGRPRPRTRSHAERAPQGPPRID